MFCFNISKANLNNQEDFVLYQNAVYDFANNEYYSSLRKLEDFAKLYPESEYSVDVTIMSIVLYFLTDKKEEALEQVAYFEQMYFLDKRLEYVYYIRLLMSYKDIKKKKKSYDSIKNTITYCDELIKMNTRYMKNVKKMKTFAVERQLQYLQEIADFYVHQKQYHAAIKTIGNLIEEKSRFGFKMTENSYEYGKLKMLYAKFGLTNELAYLERSVSGK